MSRHFPDRGRPTTKGLFSNSKREIICRTSIICPLCSKVNQLSLSSTNFAFCSFSPVWPCSLLPQGRGAFVLRCLLFSRCRSGICGRKTLARFYNLFAITVDIIYAIDENAQVLPSLNRQNQVMFCISKPNTANPFTGIACVQHSEISLGIFECYASDGNTLRSIDLIT